MNDFQRVWKATAVDVHIAVDKVGESGWYVLGKEVADFERTLARLFKLKHGVGVANGMDGLELALRVLGLKNGDRVLTTPLSAFATSLAIVRAGGVPVFVDVDECGLLDLDRAEQFLIRDSSIRFMVPVHLYGACLNLDRLSLLKARFNLRIVEDCAQSVLASWGSRSCGSIGDLAATSFYPTKNLGCMGDGGAVLTNDDQLRSEVIMLRDYGQSKKYVHTKIGLNSRLDEVQAAILNSAFVPHLVKWTERRKQIGKRYNEEIENPKLKTLKLAKESSSVFHLFPLLVEERRDKFQSYLAEKGIQSGVHYPMLISDQSALSGTNFEVVGNLSMAEKFSNFELSIPIHPFMNDEEVSYVIACCNSWNF